MKQIGKILGWALALTCVLSALALRPVAAQAGRRQVVVEKRCGACGRRVPSDSHVGQRCPYCGALWGSEDTQVTGAPQQPAQTPRPARRSYSSSPATSAWKQALLARAAAINPRVLAVLSLSSPPAAAPGVGGRQDALRDADAVYRASRNAPVAARQLALWIVRHPGSGYADIPPAYAAQDASGALLSQARALIVQAGLDPQRYHAFGRD